MLHNNHEQFVSGIHEKTKVLLTFFSKEDKSQLIRTCAPIDFGPSRRARNPADRYHFWDYDSDTGRHTLSLLPEQIINMRLMDEFFEPEEFITWSPQWFLPRDWGAYS